MRAGDLGMMFPVNVIVRDLGKRLTSSRCSSQHYHANSCTCRLDSRLWHRNTALKYLILVREMLHHTIQQARRLGCPVIWVRLADCLGDLD